VQERSVPLHSAGSETRGCNRIKPALQSEPSGD
jgi:hypothetical protein